MNTDVSSDIPPHHRGAQARPQKRGLGTGVGLPLSVFIGVHRWLTLAFLGKPGPQAAC